MMFRRSRLHRPVLAATLVAGLCAAHAAAQDMPSGPATAKLAKEFEQADSDKDGKLSDAEAKKSGFFTTDQKFDSVDADGDGQITLFEFGDAVQKRLRGYMSDRDSADADGDGYVSEGEAKASGSSILDIFRKADKDGDGKVARDEIDIFVHDSYYSETADRGVVPNIFDKKF